MRVTVLQIFGWVVMAGVLGCAGPADVTRSREYLAVGNYYQAYHEAKEALARHPEDPVLAKEERSLRLAYLLDQGQRHVFEEHERRAIEFFEEALRLAPDNHIAKAWLRKAKHKLAGKLTHRGELLLGDGDLEGALRAFHDALGLVPEFPAAKEGVAKVAEIWRKRRAKAASHYLEGVRRLAERLFRQTAYHMFIATENDSTLERAKERRELARRRLAEQRLADAKEMEEHGFYAAALQAYEECRKVLGETPEIQERIARMKREVEAAKLAEQAEIELFRRNYGKARELLEKAYDLSLAERPFLSEMLVMVRERELQDRYRAAHDEEIEGRYEKAVELYRAIQKEQPGYKDVAARISDLESALEVAAEAYERGRAAEKTGDLEKALDAYREALLVHPSYRDVEKRVEELEKRVRQRAANGTRPADAEDGGSEDG